MNLLFSQRGVHNKFQHNFGVLLALEEKGTLGHVQDRSQTNPIFIFITQRLAAAQDPLKNVGYFMDSTIKISTTLTVKYLFPKNNLLPTFISVYICVLIFPCSYFKCLPSFKASTSRQFSHKYFTPIR